MIRPHAFLWSAFLGLASVASAAETTGNPKLQSIEAICFGPEGRLIVGDGKGKQIVAINTGDVKAIEWGKLDGSDIKEQIGARLGTGGKGIEINKLAINPASHRAYVAVRKLDGKQDLIVTVDGQGKVSQLPLDNVKYVSFALPADDSAPLVKITDITYADNRVLLAVQAKEQFASKIYSIDLRDEKATPLWISTETFHVAHGRWETNAPIRTVIPYVENGKKYLVGAFTCTPIVKYSLDDLKAGARVKGQSVVELGNGNTPQDMFVYQKDGKSYVLVNNFRMAKMHEKNPVGPSQWWTAKVDQSLLGETDKINENALRRTKNKASESTTTQVAIVPEYHGVVMMDKIDDTRALVIRTDDKGGYSLAVLALP